MLRSIATTGIVACALLSGLPASASVTNDALAADAETKIEDAHHRGDIAAIEASNRALDAALEKTPRDPALLYTRSFGAYALSTQLAPEQEAEQIAVLERAIEFLEEVKSQPWEGEAAGLQANIYGQLIGLKGGLSGMMLGPRSGKLIERAKNALPDNPRLLMFEGISLLHRPAAFGGDPKQAVDLLARSVSLFSESDSTSAGPQWGHANALMWLGMTRQELGDTEGARAAWEQALQVEPEYRYVRSHLLPSLNEK